MRIFRLASLAVVDFVIDVCQNIPLQQSHLHEIINWYINYFMVFVVDLWLLPLAVLTVGI